MTSCSPEVISRRIEQIPSPLHLSPLLQGQPVMRRRLIQVLEQDETLEARILKVANSASTSTISRVSTVEHALALLGPAEVQYLLLGFSVHRFFREQEPPVHDPSGFWRHGIACGQVARYLLNYFRLRDEGMFLAGLIHDLGKLVLNYCFPDEFPQILERVDKQGVTFSVAEKKILGVTHYQVAAKLLQQWNFPRQIVRPVFYHHTPWHDREGTSASIIIFLANHFARLAGYGCMEEEKPASLGSLSNPALLKFLAGNGFELEEKTADLLLINIRRFLAQESGSMLELFALPAGEGTERCLQP